MFNISKKIEEIRRKPEHIRLRYAWLCVGVSMVFILIVWFFSLSAGKLERKTPQTAVEQKQIFDQLQEEKKSLEDATRNMKNALDNQTENSEGFSQ